MSYGLKTTFGIAGSSVLIGMGGGIMTSSGYTGLEEAGIAAGKFISPSINIGMGGATVRMLKDLKRK